MSLKTHICYSNNSIEKGISNQCNEILSKDWQKSTPQYIYQVRIKFVDYF